MHFPAWQASYCPTATPRNAALRLPSSSGASPDYRNRRIRFRRERNQLTGYSAIATRSRNAQDIAENTRSANLDWVGLNRGSLGRVNLESASSPIAVLAC